MEDSVGRPNVSKTSKKSRSLDLQTVYFEKSSISSRKYRTENGVSGIDLESRNSRRKRGSPFENRGSVVESRKKRRKKEVSLSSFELGITRRHNVLDRKRLRKSNGFVSGVVKRKNLSSLGGGSRNLSGLSGTSRILCNTFALSPARKTGNRASTVRNLGILTCLGDIVIPKRPRGILRRKKFQSSISSERTTGIPICSGKNSAYDQTWKLPVNIDFPSSVLIDKQKKELGESKGNDSVKDNSIPAVNDDNDSPVQVSKRKVRRKRQDSTIEKQTHLENEALLVDEDEKLYEDIQEDDEENLEQNAARMLSSRFDPRCTGFSGNRMASSSEEANEYLVLQNFQRNFNGLGSENASVDAAGIVLRPRKHNNKGFAGKRRHFYEVCSRDMDPYSVLKQRIRVFWPLDKIWYFGLVMDYDPVTKLHHIKYDDREEEWINLQNERFKLLLFPGELTSRLDSEKSVLGVNWKNKEEDICSNDGSCIGRFLESEPIISWLTRSAHRAKSSPFSIIKKQRRTHLSKDYRPSNLLPPKGQLAVSPGRRISNKLSSSCTAAVIPIDGDNSRMSAMKSRTGFDERKFSLVYFRRRFRKKRESLHNTLRRNSARGSLTRPITFLTSVDERAASFEEFHITVQLTEPKKVALKLSLPLQCIHYLPFGSESFWLCRYLFLLRYGKLMLVWPKVRMEIVFVDNVQGLRFLWFEGCLRQAVAVMCLIIPTFHQHTEYDKLREMQVPFTSIGFKLSGLRDQGGHLFMMYSFLELESSKWRDLEYNLKQHCTIIMELPLSDCTYANVKNLPDRCGQTFFTSVFEEPVSLEGFPERSGSIVMHQLITKQSAYLNVNLPHHVYDEKNGRLNARISFAAIPSLFLTLHLKLLMGKDANCMKFRKPSSLSSEECPENSDKLTGDGCSPVEDPDQVSEITLENLGSSLGQAATSSGWLNFGHSKVGTDALSVSNGCDQMRSSHNFINTGVCEIQDSVGHGAVRKSVSDETVVRFQRFSCHMGSWQGDGKTCSSFCEDSSCPDKPEGDYNSCLNAMDVQTQSYGQVEEPSFDKGNYASQSASNLVLDMTECTVRSPNPTAPRSIWHRNRNSSVSPTFGHRSKLWPEDFILDGFSNTYRKPRTQVSYSLPFGGCRLATKTRSQYWTRRPSKKIKIGSSKRISDGSRSPQSYLELLTCDANVLVTVGDRGWRECGAQIVLDSDGQKDWRISVKLSGVTKYVHKAPQFLQPWTTNRYTHATMWKGGKDWTLEFTDRSQWSLFKDLHEECYNRNTRAAFVKHIPIPGVRLIECDENIVEVPYVHSSSKYFRQVGTEIDLAMDSSRVLYDMDSSDEEWISKLRDSFDSKGCKMPEVTDDMFERVMDMFEKVAYAQLCDEFTSDEIEGVMADVGPLEIIKAIHEYWRQKRQKKGMPLIRQFQPALWEHYQQQLKEWELAMSKLYSSSNGYQEKACLIEKPSMFAFCLRPRGLEVPNKGSKQRSHKKFMVTGLHAFPSEQDGFHSFGRKLDEFSVGEEKALAVVPNNEYPDCFRLQCPSSSSPNDAAWTGILRVATDGSERSQHPQLSRSNSKKVGMFLSTRDSHLISDSSFNGNSKRYGIHRRSADICEWQSIKQSQPYGLQSNRADSNEFRLRDASSAAQHALNMAKLKREKAQRLLHKADLALHKAMVALMTAEAMQSSEGNFSDAG